MALLSQEEAQTIFSRLTEAGLQMVDFVQIQVLKRFGDLVEQVEEQIAIRQLNEAERLRWEFKNETRAIIQTLERFGDDLSDLTLKFAAIARVPITL